jgi:menaquinone-dependent protoporphyrinogen oxidase
VSKRSVLIAYETGEGHTATVAEGVKAACEKAGCQVRLMRCREVDQTALKGADGIVLGASVHMGKHHKRALKFAKQHQALLNQKPSAFFSVCLTAKSKKEKDRKEVQRYLSEFQLLTGWKPNPIQAFAGALLYTQYGIVKRKIMLSIVKKQGGDIDPSRDFVYTDWQAVEAFAQEFLESMPE